MSGKYEDADLVACKPAGSGGVLLRTSELHAAQHNAEDAPQTQPRQEIIWLR